MDANLTIILIAAIGAGLYMAWAIGANDVANSMGTSVGAGALTVGGAILIAGVFEFLGAFLAGGEVTSTIRKGIIDAESLQHDPDLLVVGMLSALLAAAGWLTVASRFGWPVSTTHSIVGAIIGFAVVAIGVEAVHWWDVATIAASWVVTPVLAGAIAYLLVLSVQWLIFSRDHPDVYARRYVPVYIFAAVLMTSIVTFVKGLKHAGLELSTPMAILYAVLFAAVVALVGRAVINRVSFGSVESPTGGQSRYTNVEKVFGVLMIVTASGMAFAHGSNDVANAIGPVAAIVGVVTTGEVASKSTVPPWVLLIGAVGIVVGLATFGYRVMATIGRKITELTPSRGFAAEFAAASTVVVASGTGLPVSTTQTLVGAVMGVGLARGAGALDFGVVRTIIVSWVVTLPVGAVLAVAFYYILSLVMALERRMMRFAEEILLLLRDEDGTLSRAPEWLVRYALGGAVLMDLALENRIDTDAHRLFLVDSTPVGDRLLDPMLAEIARSGDTHDALYWVDHATRHADEIREVALERLVKNGVLGLRDDRFLWIFGTRRYSLGAAEVERELKRRIGTVLTSDVVPDPRDVVIITLVDGCGLLEHLLSAGELARGRAADRAGAEDGPHRPRVTGRHGHGRPARRGQARP